MRLLCVLAVLCSVSTLGDEFVKGSAPAPGEVDRFAVLRADKPIKIDTMTGATWYLCSPPKKNRQSWCRFKEIAGLVAGPVGRYRVTESGNAVLLDTVSGRSWVRCDAPTTDKVEAWCSLDE